jgi:hypothetical protein
MISPAIFSRRVGPADDDGAIDGVGEDGAGASLRGGTVAEGGTTAVDGDELSLAEPHAARKRATPPSAAAPRSSRREIARCVIPGSSHDTAAETLDARTLARMQRAPRPGRK